MRLHRALSKRSCLSKRRSTRAIPASSCRAGFPIRNMSCRFAILTGVAIQATLRNSPVDPAGGEGFNNTGEVLAMTPNLLNKYLGAAQLVADHMVLKPNGITFAPFPVTSYAERTKLTEQAIIDFYRQHDVRISDYLEAAWRFRHRAEDERGVSLEDWAARRKLSGKYLARVSKTLDEAKTGTGYLKQLGALWDAIRSPVQSRRRSAV